MSGVVCMIRYHTAGSVANRPINLRRFNTIGAVIDVVGEEVWANFSHKWISGRVESIDKASSSYTVYFDDDSTRWCYTCPEATNELWSVQHDQIQLTEYMTQDDDVLAEIANVAGVDVSTLLEINRKRYRNITSKVRLKQGSSLLVPCTAALQSQQFQAEKIYSVEKVLDKRLRSVAGGSTVTEYLVQWGGSAADECTWEPVHQLKTAAHLVSVFESQAEKSNIGSQKLPTKCSSQRQCKRKASDGTVHNENPKRLHNKAADASEGNCPICLTPISSNPQQTTTTRCGHLFCRACLQKWLQQKRNCPMCKALIGHTRSSLPSGMTSDML